MDLSFLVNRRVQFTDRRREKGRVCYVRGKVITVLLDHGVKAEGSIENLEVLSVYLYRVSLWRESDKSEQIGMVEAENFWEAKDKAEEAARAWESQGYKLNNVNCENVEGFEKGQVHWF